MPKLTPGQILRFAREGGFDSTPVSYAGGEPQDILFTAIALAESGGNTKAHNKIPPDNSYGLWQINMIGALGPSRRRLFKLESNDQLFHPRTNAQAAYFISSHGKNPRPWSVFNNGQYRRFLEQARKGELPEYNDPLDPGDILNKINPMDDVINYVKDNSLRVGMILGGFALVLIGLSIYLTRSGLRSAVTDLIPQAKAIKGVVKGDS